MVSGWAEWVGFGTIFLMVALTCVDVVGAKVFRLPVPGSLDVMMLAQLIAISFAAVMALMSWHLSWTDTFGWSFLCVSSQSVFRPWSVAWFTCSA